MSERRACGLVSAFRATVRCQADVSEEVLERPMTEGLEQLGITVTWSNE